MQDYAAVGGADSEAASLRRQLEWELSQDSRRLESHAWYHGSIPRSHAESLLKKDGQFLIRDSSSGKSGDLVLSLCWRSTHLHFIISKVVMQPNTVYESLQYRLEDEPFDSVSDLVTFYVGSGKPVTVATGALIETPVNRSQPLSLYSTRFGPSAVASASARQHSPSISQSGLYAGQHPLPPDLGRLRRMVHPTAREYSTQSLPRPSAVDRLMRRNPSDPSLSTTTPHPSAPPKPSRVPSQLYPSSEDALDGGASNEDGNSEAVDVITQLPGRHAATLPRLRRAVSAGDRPASLTRDSFLDRRSCDLEAEAAFSHPTSPSAQLKLSRPFPSLFDVNNFQTELLAEKENKPLDMKTLEALSILFDAHSSKSIALHLLHGDLDVLGGLNPAPPHATFHYQSHYEARGIQSGVELCTLPHGDQLRMDLLERTNCLRLFVAVTVLTCPSIEDRCDMLNQWIEVAIESKTALGNLYGFAALMFALCMPQIQRLTATWNLLRQRHTTAAYTFEARLKPQATSEVMPHAPNTTVPDLHSACLLWRAASSVECLLEDQVSLPYINVTLGNSGPDFGFDLLSGHMDLIRSWSLNLPMYLRNSRKALDQVAQFDDILLDMFRTEFQAKFLWGNRGALADCHQRYTKFQQVLTALSERCE